MGKKELENAYKEEKDLTVLKRIQAIRSVNIKIEVLKLTEEKAMEVTAMELDVSVSTIKNYRRRYRDYGISGLYDLPRSGAPPIYPPEKIDAAIDELQKKGRLTARRLAIRLQEMVGGPRMSTRHARRVLAARRKSPKKAQHVNVAAAKPHQVYKWRWVFFPVILALRMAGYTIAVGDEMVVSQDANGDAVYWSDIGVPVKVPYFGDHANFTTLGITAEPGKDGRARRCHVTAARGNTVSFMDLLEKAHKEFGKIVVIVDRASWHQSNALKEYLRGKNGKIIVILLPVGSSYLNAKEQDWRQTKLAEYYSEYYSSIGKKEKATQVYLDTELNPHINIWKYLIRSPYAYRKSARRRKERYGSKGPLQYIIDKYAMPMIGANALDIVRKYGPDYVCKI